MFSIGLVVELDSVGIDVAVDDVLFNLVTRDTQLMRGSTPWRGGRKKDPILLQLLIESTTEVGDIVLDCTASTGTLFPVNLCFMALSFLFMILLLTFFDFIKVHQSTLVARPVAISWPWRGIRRSSRPLYMEPLIVDTITEGFKKQRLDGYDTADNVEVEELPDPVFTPLNRYCK
jgi:hypothetical protein